MALSQFGDVESGVRVCTAFRMKTVSDISFNAATEKAWSGAAGYLDFNSATGFRFHNGTILSQQSGGAAGAGLIFSGGQSGATNPYITSIGSFPIEFQINGNLAMKIDNSGNVVIGGTTASSKLDVAGDIEVGAADWVYWGDPSTNGTWRRGRDGDNFVAQRRESDSYVTKETIVP